MTTTRRLAALRVATALAVSVGVSACADSAKLSDGRANTAQRRTNPGSQAAMAAASVPRYRAAGQGMNYEWGKDHIFIKVSTAETGGLVTLIQDNLKPGFDLALHLHRTHTEIFYILEGEVEFTIGAKPVTATAGAVVYVPAGTPHAAKSSKGGKMLMFFLPGGFDEMLAEIENASWFQRINPLASARRDEKYDIHKAATGEQSATDGPMPRYLAPGEGKNIAGEGDHTIVKLSSTDTGGLATLIEANLKAGKRLAAPLGSKQAQIAYVLDGEVEFKIADQMQTATVGATIYFPPGIPLLLTSSTGAKMVVFRTPGGANQ